MIYEKATQLYRNTMLLFTDTPTSKQVVGHGIIPKIKISK